MVLEEWDLSPWHLNPPAPAVERLIELIGKVFVGAGGEIDAGRRLLELLGSVGIDVPLQFATALEQRLLSLVTADELEQLRKDGEAELEEPGRWGTTFMLVQCWGKTQRRDRS